MVDRLHKGVNAAVAAGFVAGKEGCLSEGERQGFATLGAVTPPTTFTRLRSLEVRTRPVSPLSEGPATPDKLVNASEFPRVVRLLRMQKNDAAELSAKVAESKGLVYAYVHPYYPDRNAFLARQERFSPYRERRDAEISDLLSAGKPVVIFEENRQVHELSTSIGELPRSATLYVVSTVSGGPDPLGSSWDRVGQVLHEANVQEISLGGTFIEFQDIGTSSPLILSKYTRNSAYGDPETQRWKFKGTYHITNGCAGVAADELAQRNFFISHSLATSS